MKKIKALLALIVILIAINSNAQEHPWEKYGFKPKIITLSKGKYQEFHDNDTIVEIGSAIFDRKNGKIIGIVEVDTSRTYEVLKPYVISRWISPDPHAENYFSWAPYTYAANNPILFIDPDGMDWVKSVDKNGNVHYTVTVQIRNSANIDEDKLKTYAEAIQKATQSIFQGTDENGVSYSTTVVLDWNREDKASDDFYLDFVENVTDIPGYKNEELKDTDGGISDGSGKSSIGNTETNRIQIKVGKSTKQVAFTGAHEIGHTGGLHHPQFLQDPYGFPVKPNNIMIPSDNYTGTSITKVQLKRISSTIDNGVKPIPSREIKSKGIENTPKIDINKIKIK